MTSTGNTGNTGNTGSTRRTIPPHDQPLRPAIALLVVAVTLLVLSGVVAVLPLLLAANMEASLSSGAMPPVGVMLVAGLVLVLLLLGLGLASFILAVVVAVKGDGALRVGAALLIAASVVELVVSVTVSGDTSRVPEAVVAVSTVFSVLEMLVEVAKFLAVLVGVGFLAFGIRTVRQRRAELARS